MGFVQDFKEFAVKGNVVDLAVGVIIGAAFGKIVTSLVNDIVMPPIGYMLQGVDFSKMAYQIGTNDKGEPVLLKYGEFINNCIHFLIVALVIFIVIKQFARLKRQPETPASTVRECPYCAEPISKKASKCPHCTGDVIPEPMPA